MSSLRAGATYTFSMRARLAAPAAAPVGVRFVAKPGYSWIGATSMTADSWTTVTGTYTVPDPAPTDPSVYIGTADLSPAAPYTYLVDDIVVTGPPADPGTSEQQTLVDTGFEDGTLQGWTSRDAGAGPATLAVTDADPHSGTYAARISERTGQGQGPQLDVTATAVAGRSYALSAWVRFEGEPGDMTLSAHTRSGGADAYSNLVQLSGLTQGWTKVSGTFTMPAFDDVAQLYLETRWAGGAAGNVSTFVVDDILVVTPQPSRVQDLTPLQDTIDVPVGVAIDSRETTGTAAELLLRHFGQVTGENSMKVEAWYDGDHQFRRNPEATTLMDFAVANGLRVYGHTLVWHSQTPDWFFQDDSGRDLTDSAADQQILRDRLRTHVVDVAKDLSDDYGPFGSSTNPLVAFDVVNEVVDDGSSSADGLRRSRWYQVLGEQYIDLAFQYADEAFNHLYAAAGADRPITLLVNDYNTEQSGKRGRLHALVERLLARGVPVDGVGHQFHLSLSTPISSLDEALTAFEDLPVVQAVTELDVAVNSADTAKLIDQGYFYRDAFDVFRAHVDRLFSVTVWGLTDGRSWRAANNGKPLLFDDEFQAKPAFFGAAGLELPDRQRSALAFGAGEADLSIGSDTWRALPTQSLGKAAAFGLRWSAATADEPATLSVRVDVADPTSSPDDAVQVQVDGTTWTLHRDRSGGAAGDVTSRDDGWTALVQVPLPGATQGSGMLLDVRTVDHDEATGTDTQTGGWASAQTPGTVTLVEPLSAVDVPQATATPTIDGEVDAAYTGAATLRTAKQIVGTTGAQADVKVLWADDTLLVLADVTDPDVDTTGSDPWTQDSVEIYVDPGNAKNGSYRSQDTQIRISADGVVSFGTGDEAAQVARLAHAMVRTPTGYRVEAAVGLVGAGGLDTFQGLDVQVNDASGGVRSSITNWADPTNAGYQSTAHWGVAHLVGPAQVAPAVTTQPVSTTGALGATVTLTAAASGMPAPTAQWQRLVRGTWADVPGATGPSLAVNVSAAGGTYRVVFSNVAGSATSDAVTVGVTRTAPTIVAQPRTTTWLLGVTLISAHAEGYPAPRVQWFEKRAGSSQWTAVPWLLGGTSETMLVLVPWLHSGSQFRMVATNDVGSATSAAVTLRR